MDRDLGYFDEWLARVEALARELRRRADETGGRAVFTVSTTTKVPEGELPYLTPLRAILHGFVGGSVVFSQTQAILACRRIDGLVDDVLVDAEKKIGVRLGAEEDLLARYGLQKPPRKRNTRVHVEMGNLSAACAGHVAESRFQEFKPNDLTVEAVWHFLSQHFRVLSGLRAAVVGAGNIGFKLALKLVESGCHVELVRRDLRRGMMMADVINLTKPPSTLAAAHYNADPLQASLFADILVGATDGVAVITWEMMQGMKEHGVIVDVAKGSVHREAARRAVEAGLPLVRCDIASAIDGAVATMERNRLVTGGAMGRREALPGLWVVSGGRLGLEGDLVVDHFAEPGAVLGVADGAGDLKTEISDADRAQRERLERWMEERGPAAKGGA